MGYQGRTREGRSPGVATHRSPHLFLVGQRFGAGAATTPAECRNDYAAEGVELVLAGLGGARTPRRRYRGLTLASRRTR